MSPLTSKIASTALATLSLLTTGGRISMTLSGAKTAAVEIRDAGFCVTDASLGRTTMHMFAFAGNNPAWGLTISSSNGMPGVGDHVVDPASSQAVRAGLIDKSSGADRAGWERYTATGGNVTISRADAGHVAGSFKFTARPLGAPTSAPTVTAEGTFEATPTDGCEGATSPRR